MSSDCPICFEEIGNIDCATTACGHQFHLKCMISSITRVGSNCPYCRQVVAEMAVEDIEVRENLIYPSINQMVVYASSDRIRYINFINKYFKKMNAKNYIPYITCVVDYDEVLEDQAVRIGFNWNFTNENVGLFREIVLTEVEKIMTDRWDLKKK